MKFIPLIEHTRGSLPEIVHPGAIAVVNASGQLLRSAGDPQALSFTRSTLKPFQALQCGCHVPLRFSYGGLTAPKDLQFDERHNNCSGKHAGFLGY